MRYEWQYIVVGFYFVLLGTTVLISSELLTIIFFGVTLLVIGSALLSAAVRFPTLLVSKVQIYRYFISDLPKETRKNGRRH